MSAEEWESGVCLGKKTVVGMGIGEDEENGKLTPAFETWLVPCNSGEVLPYPSQHLFALLYATECWGHNILQGA